MKDNEGYLPKGWMLHPPYELRNGTPALAIYTYLYRTTKPTTKTKPPSYPPEGGRTDRAQEGGRDRAWEGGRTERAQEGGRTDRAWEGTVQTLADIVEIPIRTTRRCIHELEQRGLIEIQPLGYSHYSIKALRLTRNESEEGQFGTVVGQIGTVVGQIGTEVGQIGTAIKDNINIKENINKTHSGGGEKETIAPTATAASNDFICRKDYIAKVLSHTIPDYPFGIVYEYAGLVNMPREIVDSFIIHYEQTGWKMKNGGKISNWVAALKNWQVREAKFTQRCQAPLCKNGGIVSQMSEKNRAVFEEEQERKRREKERRDQESQQALSYDEYQALKQRLQGSVS